MWRRKRGQAVPSPDMLPKNTVVEPERAVSEFAWVNLITFMALHRTSVSIIPMFLALFLIHIGTGG